MSDNPDLKSKILLMRQKNFGEVINESSEKNDNKKLENSEIKEDEDVIKANENEISVTKNELDDNIQLDKNLEISELKESLNKVAESNEKAFDLLANKFNESVEVILELTQRVEKLETVSKLQSMQESVKKNEVKPSQKGLKLFIFLLFVAGISYFIYRFNIDLSILKGISREFLAIIGRWFNPQDLHLKLSY